MLKFTGSGFTPSLSMNELCEKKKNEWFNNLTHQRTPQEFSDAIIPVWKTVYNRVPKITICPSPVSCRKEELENGKEHFSLWLIPYAAKEEFCKENGLPFDTMNFNTMVNWAKCCHFVYYNENEVFVSQNPITLKSDEHGNLHNKDGPAIEYADGVSIYAIHGVVTPNRGVN